MDRFEEESSFECPCCMQANSVMVDLTAGNRQQFVYDCAVCCRPILITLALEDGSVCEFMAEKE